MARFQLLLMVTVFGVGCWNCALAALATTIEHLPEEQNTHRHHAYQKQDSQPHKKSASMTSTTGPSQQTGTEPAYQLEHGQSEAKARQYVASMTDEQLLAPAWCKECNATVLHYCRTSRFLNDHCCCENSHAREQLPWIYHTCHRQLEGDCKVNAGTCGKYRVFKECCCDRETKLEAKRLYSAGSAAGPAWLVQLLAPACAFTLSVLLHQLS